MRHGKSKSRQGKSNTPTHWGKVADWYDDLVGDEGTAFHKDIIFPRVLRLLSIRPEDAVLDLACGQGAFCRVLCQAGAKATGVDASPELIRLAREHGAGPSDRGSQIPMYLVGDARDLSFLPEGKFAAASCLLAIQNIDRLGPTFQGVARALVSGGRFVIVMMHPCFRGPKHTGWEWDQARGVQFRRVDRYLLPRKDPIITHPGNKTGEYTWSFHRPLEWYIRALRGAGFLVDALEEWASEKTSTSGPRASAENQARKEIPMFLALRAIKAKDPR